MNKIVFGSFRISTRLSDHFDKLLKLKRWLSVGELRHSRCVDGLLLDLCYILGYRFSSTTRATIVCSDSFIEI